MATARSPAPGSTRPDPVGELAFRIAIPGISIGRFQEVTGLSVEIETLDYQEGGNNDYVHKLPGRITYPNVVLKRGVTHHDALQRWLFETHRMARQVEMAITLMGPGGESVRSWAFPNAYPVKWTGPNLSAGSTQVATETLEVVHTGLRTT